MKMEDIIYPWEAAEMRGKAETHRTTHTPTPWKVVNGSIYDANGTRLAMMDRETGNGTSPTERDANAHFIVLAVNAYDENEQARIAQERRQAVATHGALIARQQKIEHALSDIRETLKDGTHDGTPYEQEKMEERDKFLTEWHQVTKQIKFLS